MTLHRRDWLLGVGAALCLAPKAHATERDALRAFGGPVTLLTPPGTAAAARRDVLHRLAVVNASWNAWKPGELTALNDAFRAGRALTVSPALRRTLQGAAALERATGGRFNAAIGGLVGAWGFHDDVLRAGPAPEGTLLGRWQEPVPSLDSLVDEGGRLRSHDPRVQVDLGGYAKGVALDDGLARLRRAGAAGALLDLGGNLAAFGDAGGRPWQVGLRDPFGPGLMGTLSLRGGEAVVTSGTYERWREVGGRRLGHVIDPARGRPAEALASVTVVHPSAALADAAATALLVAGPAAWVPLAARLGLAQVLVVDATGRREATPALAARLNRQA